jgi:hypothetical protein
VRRAARRHPAAAGQPTGLPAYFARAGGTGLGQVDGLLDARGGLRRELAVPVESQRAEFLFDLCGLEGAGLCLDRGADPDAGALQQVAPAVADERPPSRRRRVAGGVEEVRIALDERTPPIVVRYLSLLACRRRE